MTYQGANTTSPCPQRFHLLNDFVSPDCVDYEYKVSVDLRMIRELHVMLLIASMALVISFTCDNPCFPRLVWPRPLNWTRPVRMVPGLRNLELALQQYQVDHRLLVERRP